MTDMNELFEERAAILEYMGNMTRAEAERLAQEQMNDWITAASLEDKRQ